MIIGSRGSPLALRQTEMALDLMRARGVDAEIKVVKTSGDLFLDRPLHMLSGQGVFVREIDERMLAGEIDLAVHSMKDLPSKRPPRISIAAIMQRDSPHDVLLSREGYAFDELPEGALVGTSSMRRSSQIHRARPDLRTESIRGNLQTRLRKLQEGNYDAIILAEAGIQRMGLDLEYSILDRERFVPSANQGTIVVAGVRGSEGEAAARLIDHPPSRRETLVERRVLEVVGGGCVVPVAVHARAENGGLRLVAEVLSLDGRRFVRVDENLSGEGQELMDQAEKLGCRLVNMGGRELVEEAIRIGR
ncbi:MAG: hydroxymethylbilane synthase [Methanosarcinales archaeon]|nr:hydroxymethylbilane synthase [Methanosarcinales archaeon]